MTTDCLNRILTRRSVYDFKPTPIDDRVIERALLAAVSAPNHGLTEPWRFYVLGRETQGAVAEIYADLRASKRFDRGDAAWQKAYDKAYARFAAIPCVVLVGQVLAEDLVQREEDYAAVAAAIENFLLALWCQDIGSQWSTGPVIRDLRTYALLGIDSTQARLQAALYCGEPACMPPARERSWETVTKFLK
ncbi:Nitroreductase [Sulfurivirga caldicuralii]|uniref:Nitroreductase n=1 Tax=Sulfurivirga caldicuralii TaxID=364032 RepID=A0A1N6HBA2_9GAMM|nr:nitroreductase [Sulfurivirga caldicuralii]SIO17036.1 Nitroreductase [Sulfurivirga caldicuralii]